MESVLAPLSVARIRGVGKVTRQRFDRPGIQTIGQLKTLSLQQLQDEFGRNGEHFRQLARRIDNRTVIADREAKTISHETTFAEDICDMDVLRAWLMELTEQVALRLRRYEIQGRTVHLKIRYSNFDTCTRTKSVSPAKNATITSVAERRTPYAGAAANRSTENHTEHSVGRTMLSPATPLSHGYQFEFSSTLQSASIQACNRTVDFLKVTDFDSNRIYAPSRCLVRPAAGSEGRLNTSSG